MQVLTFSSGHGFTVGDRITIDVPKPRWWQLIKLWRWRRNKHQTFFVDSVSATTVEVRPPKRELVFVKYSAGDRLLRANEGWQLARPEEDFNRQFGWVYLERYR